MSARAASKASHVAPGSTEPKRTSPLSIAEASHPAAPSPARLAQLELAARLAKEPEISGRWSARRSLGFAVAASAVLWAALAVAGGALLG